MSKGKTKGKATEAQLSDLHGLTWAVMTEELERHRARAAAEPDYQVPAQFLSQVTKFLKDNGTTSESLRVDDDKHLSSISAPIDDMDDDYPMNGFN